MHLSLGLGCLLCPAQTWWEAVTGKRAGGPKPFPIPASSPSQPISKMLEVAVPRLGEEHACLITKPHSNNHVND